MDTMSKKLKFVIIMFTGMISLLVIYDHLNVNHYIYHYINKSIHNSIVINNGVGDNINDMNENDLLLNNFNNINNINNDIESNNNNIANNNNNVENISGVHQVVHSSRQHISNNNSNILVNYKSHNNNETHNISHYDSQYKVIKSEIRDFEHKYLETPIVRRSANSRLLYADVIREITGMTVGNERCDQNYGNDTRVVIIVISRVNGFETRNTIRETWGKIAGKSRDDSIVLAMPRGVKMYFALGQTLDRDVEHRVLEEHRKFGDILQWNFIDNYYNLTVKSLGILRWISINCFNVRFVYKVDDDCIVNTENLVKFTETMDGNTIYGQFWHKSYVDRNLKSKFYISRKDFKGNAYPDYTGGPWLMAGHLIPKLYEIAITRSLPALPWEDVFVTGVVASKARVARKQLKGLVYYAWQQFNQLNYCWFRENIIFWQNLDKKMIINGWKNIVNTRDMICIHKGSTIYPLITN
ncbi:beta-1,3-galactosyltransferase bre-2-like [Oppia nitens]|uniref:beta-1,3-galactosyltransferase bre-2-like n=1 Tax=Oppia nitens TaxID=1686743 RepID=UPI0023DBB495|nr:beta-1,3-galactosyltransferase bre-2-like [Oppia nitens]XP_054156919.1 beta-1,3-galactosyltransferase bre-2-like [Oppia nitens]